MKIRVPSGVRLRHAPGYCRVCGNRRWHWLGCDAEKARKAS